MYIIFFFFNDTATTEIYTLSLHDALPISREERRANERQRADPAGGGGDRHVLREPAHAAHVLLVVQRDDHRSEEHTSELQSQSNLVCRLLLEKKKDRMHCETLIYSLVTVS